MLRALRQILILVAIAAGAGICAPVYAGNDGAGNVTAEWQPQQATFHYTGFTTHYSCDGIKYKLRLLLRTIGASDIKISDICTAPWGEPQRFHTLKLSFSVPVPTKKGSKGESFPAEWRDVQLSTMNPLDLDRGDCELVEQLRDQILPLFNARNVVNRTACIPHQESVGQPYLRMSLLMPVNKKKA